jgi:hypothetical protein
MRTVVVALLLTVAVAAPEAGAASSSVLVRFDQTGGFAGIERGLVVHRSGKVVSDGLPLQTEHLSSAGVEALRGALARARWATLQKRYESETPIADGFVFRITYAGRTIRVEEGAKLPARLARPFKLLSALGGITD